MVHTEKKFDLANFEYYLPEGLIAQEPAETRDGARLMILNRASGRIRETVFSDLARYIPADALLVVNNSRVFPARLYGYRPSGGKVEFLLLSPLSLLVPEQIAGEGFNFTVNGLLRSSKPIRCRDEVVFAEDLKLTVLERGEYGQVRAKLRLDCHGGNPVQALEKRLFALGHMPLPPYIKNISRERDFLRYQTIYAAPDQAGSVAAPTAGLHFTPQLRDSLRAAGIGWAELTLHVGYGTFSPLRCGDIREHRMHAEYVHLPEETAESINRAKKEGRPVIAVGTTVLRALEGAYKARGRLQAYSGWTDIYITPGVEIMIADQLITNFHLPGSSLLVLVCAMAGRNRILKAYNEAIRRGFRFFSYGDAMLIC